MKLKRTLCTILAIVCVITSFSVMACAEEPVITEQAVDLQLSAVENSLSPLGTSYSEVYDERFTVVKISNFSEATLYVTIDSYSYTISTGKMKTFTYETYALRTITLTSTEPLNYTISFD